MDAPRKSPRFDLNKFGTSAGQFLGDTAGSALARFSGTHVQPLRGSGIGGGAGASPSTLSGGGGGIGSLIGAGGVGELFGAGGGASGGLGGLGALAGGPYGAAIAALPGLTEGLKDAADSNESSASSGRRGDLILNIATGRGNVSQTQDRRSSEGNEGGASASFLSDTFQDPIILGIIALTIVGTAFVVTR